MPAPSLLRFSRTVLAPMLLIGVPLGTFSACARSVDPSQVEPEAAPAADSTTAADLTSGEVQRRSREPIASLLQGRTAGVTVSVAANGAIAVRVAGAASFLSSTEPLYVVDGTPFTPGPGGTLTGINPEDIQSIEVLKYPPETSLYGVRGANGVIVITTIRPLR